MFNFLLPSEIPYRPYLLTTLKNQNKTNSLWKTNLYYTRNLTQYITEYSSCKVGMYRHLISTTKKENSFTNQSNCLKSKFRLHSDMKKESANMKERKVKWTFIWSSFVNPLYVDCSTEKLTKGSRWEEQKVIFVWTFNKTRQKCLT